MGYLSFFNPASLQPRDVLLGRIVSKAQECGLLLPMQRGLCVCVRPVDMTVGARTTNEPIETPFEMWTRSRNVRRILVRGQFEHTSEHSLRVCEM